MRSERELLKEKLDIATGQLQAMSKQVEALSRHLSGGAKGGSYVQPVNPKRHK